MKDLNITEFGSMVLNREGLNDWKIEMVLGDEGFCHKETKVITFGEDSKSIKLMLHEIAHCLTDAHHYSYKFQQTVKKLEKKYLNPTQSIQDRRAKK